MTIAEDFLKAFEGNSVLERFIEYIEPTDYGCKYLWDGYMNCHIVLKDGRYYDVQDVPDEWKPWEDRGDGEDRWNSYETVTAMVDRMKEVFDD